jgi:dipeptidyl aminopeptidase/acylaminoacyl peptidase
MASRNAKSGRWVAMTCALGLWLAVPAAHAGSAAAGTAAAAPAAATASVPPPGPSVFGALPAVSSPALSPGGARLAWVEQGDAGSRVVAFEVGSGARARVIPIAKDLKPRSVAWADDDTLLVDVSIAHEVDRRRTYEFFRTLAVDFDGGAPARLLLMGDPERRWVTNADLLSMRGSRPGTVVMGTLHYMVAAEAAATDSRIAPRQERTGWRYGLFEVDTRTGKATMLDPGTPTTSQWVISADGRPVARADYSTDPSRFRVAVLDGRQWREILDRPIREMTLADLAPDGKSIVALGEAGGDRVKLWQLPLDGAPMRVLYEHPEYDLEGLARDAYTRAPIAVDVGGSTPAVHWLDPAAEALHAKLARAFPGRTVEVQSRSRSGQRVIAGVGSASAPTVYYLVDFEQRRADIAAETYPGLAGVALGEVETFSYTSRDGVTIPAYVTYPPGLPRKDLPMIVLPHGGPAARDRPEFDWLVQFLATRGYAVLQPQFRGSTGFGREFREAGYREWGGRMQNDVSDGVRTMVARGAADGGRVCIVGASYGGYAALAGATMTPDLYRCAVSINGVADLPAMLAYASRNRSEAKDRFKLYEEFVGHPWDADLRQRSPAAIASRARVPILLLHGAEDTVVPVDQSRMMARALEDAGRPHTFVKLPGEDHWLSRPATRVRVLEELERFLAEQLAP